MAVFTDIIDAKIVKCLVDRIQRGLINPVTGEVFKLDDIKIAEIKTMTATALEPPVENSSTESVTDETTHTSGIVDLTTPEPTTELVDSTPVITTDEPKVEEPTKSTRRRRETTPKVVVTESDEQDTSANDVPYQDDTNLTVPTK